MIAYSKGTHGVALSLLSISLESALRDALVELGYNYASSGPSSDVYEMSKVKFSKSGDAFKVEPLDPMPKSITEFLDDKDNDSIEVNVKRSKNNKGKWHLKLTSGVDDIVDYISKDTIESAGG